MLSTVSEAVENGFSSAKALSKSLLAAVYKYCTSKLFTIRYAPMLLAHILLISHVFVKSFNVTLIIIINVVAIICKELFNKIQPLDTLHADGGRYIVGIREIVGSQEAGHAPITVYYPALTTNAFEVNSAHIPTTQDLNIKTTYKLAKESINWLPFNDTRYFDGLSAYSHVPRIFFHDLSLVKIAAWKDAPLAPLFDEVTGEARPVIVFSHGLAGYAHMYSTLLMNLASHGAIVFALTHMDGSAAYCRNIKTQNTLTAKEECERYIEKKEQRQQLEQEEEEELEEEEEEEGYKETKNACQQSHTIKHKQKTRGQNNKDIHELSIMFNTALQSTVEDRREQLIQRTRELSIAVERVLTGELLLRLGATDEEVAKFNELKTPVTLMGHSFGGATVMATLLHNDNLTQCSSQSQETEEREQHRQHVNQCENVTLYITNHTLSSETRKRIASAIVFDPWHIILNSELFVDLLKCNAAHYTTPTLMIESEEWMRIPSNVSVLEEIKNYSSKLYYGPGENDLSCSLNSYSGKFYLKICIINGTAHRTIADIAIVNPVLGKEKYVDVKPSDFIQ